MPTSRKKPFAANKRAKLKTPPAPFSSERNAKIFAQKMKKPWFVFRTEDERYSDNVVDGYETLISDEDFIDALYSDADAFYSKRKNADLGFDIRNVFKERMIYFMIDEELCYLLSGEFLDKKVTLQSVNIVRKAIGLKPLTTVGKQAALKNRLKLAIEKLPYWLMRSKAVMGQEPYKKATKNQLEKIVSPKKRKEDEKIRHSILAKNPEKLRSVYGLD